MMTTLTPRTGAASYTREGTHSWGARASRVGMLQFGQRTATRRRCRISEPVGGENRVFHTGGPTTERRLDRVERHDLRVVPRSVDDADERATHLARTRTATTPTAEPMPDDLECLRRVLLRWGRRGGPGVVRVRCPRMAGRIRSTMTRWRRRHTPEQIIRKLAEGHKQLAAGQSLEEVCRHQEIAESTGHRWLAQHDGMKASDTGGSRTGG